MTNSELKNFGDNLSIFSSPIANEGDKTNISNGGANNTDLTASIKFGLPSKMGEPLDTTGIPVPRQDLNGIFNVLSRLTHYLMAGGTVPWLVNESAAIGGYPLGAIVYYNGGLYRSLVDSNNSVPTDSSKWEPTYLMSPDTLTRLTPVGTIIAFSGLSAPEGYLFCDGSAVPRSQYSDLFSTIGVLYGSGDGSTTFNIPNLIDVFLQGSSTPASTKEAGLPNITGTLRKIGSSETPPVADGAFGIVSTSGDHTGFEANRTGYVVSINASRSSSIYGKSTTVQPPAVTVRYCIKF
jgi:microcystin-dependent protein